MSAHQPVSPDTVLQPRELGQILDQNFRVFGRSWRSLLSIGLVAAAPRLLFGLVVLFMTTELASLLFDPWTDPVAYGGLSDFAVLAALGLLALIALLVLLFYPLFKGALIDVAARAVLHMDPVPLGESFRVGASRYGAMLGAHVLLVLLFIVALPVLALAGLVILAILTVPLGMVALAVFTVFTGHAVLVEQMGPVQALRRSFELAKSRFWPVLGAGFVYTILGSVLGYIIVGPFSFGATIVSELTGSLAPLALLYVVEALVYAVITPFMAVGLTLVYFDTRIRREGYDLEMMARQQAESGAADEAP